MSMEPHRVTLGKAFDWASAHVPHFECSDDDITQAYWYRWMVRTEREEY